MPTTHRRPRGGRTSSRFPISRAHTTRGRQSRKEYWISRFAVLHSCKILYRQTSHLRASKGWTRTTEQAVACFWGAGAISEKRPETFLGAQVRLRSASSARRRFLFARFPRGPADGVHRETRTQSQARASRGAPVTVALFGHRAFAWFQAPTRPNEGPGGLSPGSWPRSSCSRRAVQGFMRASTPRSADDALWRGQ